MPVWAAARGHTVGVFDSWSACEKSVKGFSRALYKRFAGRADATAWLAENTEPAGSQATEAGAGEAADGRTTAAPDGTQPSAGISDEQRARAERSRLQALRRQAGVAGR